MGTTTATTVHEGAGTTAVITTPTELPRYDGAKLAMFKDLILGRIERCEETIRNEKEVLRAGNDEGERECVEKTGALDVDSGQGAIDASERIGKAQKALIRLYRALDNVKKGTFGVCARCDKPHLIDENRLRACVEATTCN
jgi:RNA polymerase-binding transcription factor DksA